MPTEVCPKCGAVIGYSKLDTLEKVHKCYPKFADRIKTKPVIEVETKSDEILEPATVDPDSGEAEDETSALPFGNKSPRRRYK